MFRLEAYMQKRLSLSETPHSVDRLGPDGPNTATAYQSYALQPSIVASADYPDHISDAGSWHSDDLDHLIAGLEEGRIGDSNECTSAHHHRDAELTQNTESRYRELSR